MTELQRWLSDFVRRSSFSQWDIACELGISEKHLSELMNGHAEGSLSMWQEILDLLNVDLGVPAD